MIKSLFIIIFIYFLVLFQTSFLIHFSVFNIIPNFIFLFIIIWNIFESPEKKSGLFYAIFAGFLMDVFSSHTIGYNILILALSSFAIKIVLKRYVRIPFAKIS